MLNDSACKFLEASITAYLDSLDNTKVNKFPSPTIIDYSDIRPIGKSFSRKETMQKRDYTVKLKDGREVTVTQVGHVAQQGSFLSFFTEFNGAYLRDPLTIISYNVDMVESYAPNAPLVPPQPSITVKS